MQCTSSADKNCHFATLANAFENPSSRLLLHSPTFPTSTPFPHPAAVTTTRCTRPTERSQTPAGVSVTPSSPPALTFTALAGRAHPPPARLKKSAKGASRQFGGRLRRFRKNWGAERHYLPEAENLTLQYRSRKNSSLRARKSGHATGPRSRAPPAAALRTAGRPIGGGQCFGAGPLISPDAQAARRDGIGASENGLLAAAGVHEGMEEGLPVI